MADVFGVAVSVGFHHHKKSCSTCRIQPTVFVYGFSREEILRDSRLQVAQVMYFVFSSRNWRVRFIVALFFCVCSLYDPSCLRSALYDSSEVDFMMNEFRGDLPSDNTTWRVI